MTHERGHSFGMGHKAGYGDNEAAQAEADHGKLTMSPDTEGPCQASETTLGRGDILTLRTKP